MMRYLRYFVGIYLFLICISISSISNAASLSEKLPLDISRNVFNVVFTNPNGMPKRDVFLSDITISKVQNDGWAYGSYKGPQGLKYGWFNLNGVVLTNGLTVSSILSNEMVVKSYANVYANVYNNAPSITNALSEGVRVTAISNNISNRILCIYRLNNRNCLGWIPTSDLIKSSEVKEPLPGVSYIGKYESFNAEVSKNGDINGAATRPKKLEAFNIVLNSNKAGSNTAIAFRGYYNGAWEQWKSSGSVWSGKPGMAYPIEAIAAQLTGEWATKYDLYYRVHINSYGWSGWARNGEAAGSKGDNRMIDAMQVELVYKGEQHEHASNSFLTLMSSKIDAKIIGNITSITSRNNNQISVVGTCRYDTIPRYEAKVSIYVGGDKGDANAYRTETIAKFANNVDGWFGITCSGIQKVGNQVINIYGYNKYTGKDEKIYSGKHYINGNFNHKPQGTITSFYSPSANKITLTGKVYDMDDMNKDIELHVYIGNDLGGSDKFKVPANKEFSHTYTVKNVPGKQAYTVWAIDDYGPNQDNAIIARGTVDVKTTPVSPPPNPQPVTRTALRKAKAYATSSLNSVYGNEWVDKGDVVIVLEETVNAYKVRYPVSNGYKERWVSKNIFEEESVGNKITNALNWMDSNRNKKVGTGQCVALIKKYAELLGLNNPVANGNACDYATNPLQYGWTRVEGGVPQPGDILVYKGATYGHVAIYAGGNVSYHQNMAGKWIEKKTNWPYNNRWYSSAEKGNKYYWGYIRPNV